MVSRTKIRDSVTVEGFAGLRQMVYAMIQPLQNPYLQREQWQTTVEVLEEMHEEYFASATDPLGAPWAPLSPVTVAAKGHARILIDTEDLFQSLTDSGASEAIREFDGEFILFGTRREWAWTHMEGNPDRNLPQRIHTGIREDKIPNIVDVIADAAVELMFN